MSIQPPRPEDVPLSLVAAGSQEFPVIRVAPPQRPGTSLTASARRLTKANIKGGSFKKSSAAGWQEDAWEMYDLVGEQRFLASTLAGRLSQAKLFIGKKPEDAVGDPVPVDDENIQNVLDAIGGGAAGRAQLIHRLGINLFVAGDGWLVGIPEHLLADYDPIMDGSPESHLTPEGEPVIGDLQWRMLSVSEVTFMAEEVTLHLGADRDDQITADPDDLIMIRVWRPHPRKSWEADSPTRSSLAVLRELVGLTMHISAQVDSRLAGAGMLIVPASAVRAMKQSMGIPEESDEDPLTDALLEAMLKPIGDRAAASAVVPLVVTAPDDVTDSFNFITFAKPLDSEARSLRDEAIRRLALGQDAPPELLLGTGGMNHWGAWLVREDVVTTHIEPPLALICDALTHQYLQPVLQEMGFSEDEAREYVVWYDVSDMIARPNRGPDAIALHGMGLVSDSTARAANGFDESNAPGMDVAEATAEENIPDLAGMKAIELVLAMPELLRNPGLDAVTAQVRNAMFPKKAVTTEEIEEKVIDTETEETSGAVSRDTTPSRPSALPDPVPGTVIPNTSQKPAPTMAPVLDVRGLLANAMTKAGKA